MKTKLVYAETIELMWVANLLVTIGCMGLGWTLGRLVAAETEG